MTTLTRGTRGMAMAVALGATVALGACAKKDTTLADTTAMVTTPVAGDTMMGAGMTSSSSMNNMNSMSSQNMSDADIFAMVSAANKGEIAAGKMAESKATNASVRAFGKDMVIDHTMLLDKGNALAKRLNITPSPSADSAITRMNNSMASELTSAPKGMAFDSMYVNGQVQAHQMTLDLLKSAEGKAQNAELKTMLGNAQPIVQKHLDRITQIQGQMK